jgi:hypothetical protein
MAPNKTAPAGWTPVQGDDHIHDIEDSTGSTTAAQRARLLAALMHGPVDTFMARAELDISSPAPRVLELRRAGNDIAMTMEERTSPAGELHRIGVYRLNR